MGYRVEDFLISGEYEKLAKVTGFPAEILFKPITVELDAMARAQAYRFLETRDVINSLDKKDDGARAVYFDIYERAYDIHIIYYSTYDSKNGGKYFDSPAEIEKLPAFLYDELKLRWKEVLAYAPKMHQVGNEEFDQIYEDFKKKSLPDGTPYFTLLAFSQALVEKMEKISPQEKPFSSPVLEDTTTSSVKPSGEQGQTTVKK